MLLIREAARADVPTIVRLLAADQLGAHREDPAELDDASPDGPLGPPAWAQRFDPNRRSIRRTVDIRPPDRPRVVVEVPLRPDRLDEPPLSIRPAFSSSRPIVFDRELLRTMGPPFASRGTHGITRPRPSHGHPYAS